MNSMSSNLPGYCPSCMKEKDDFGICEDCIERRDKKVEHSEEDIQKHMQKNLDKYRR